MKKCSADEIKSLLAGYKRKTLQGSHIQAAVLIPIIIGGGTVPELLLTKRKLHLNSHGGEFSFPGGVFEEQDESLEKTALRETFEEVGIKCSDITVSGVLDDIVSKTGFCVTPFVGIINEPFDLFISEDEVERVCRIPLSFFVDKSTKWTDVWVSGGEARIVHFHRYGDEIIWGLTAKVIDNLLRILKVLDF